MAGNEAFKEGDYQQAAVFYTEALALPTTAHHHVVFSNCAACMLKLGRYEQVYSLSTRAIGSHPGYILSTRDQEVRAYF